MIMRVSTPLALLLCSLLAGCATNPDALINKEIEQSGPLKVHPGLVEKPEPARTSAVASPPPAPAVSAHELKATAPEETRTDPR
jgi:peptidoglycan-associated lipoprotein